MKHPVAVAWILLTWGACAPAAIAQPATRPWEAMDHGPMMTATLESKASQRNITQKAIAIHLGLRKAAHVIFDQDLLRYSVGWSGDFIDWRNIQMDGSHRTWAAVKGDEVFGNPFLPGWGNNGSFADPRRKYKSTDYNPQPAHWTHRGYGPLPREWGRYKGLYLHGHRVILSYVIAGVSILDSPDWEQTTTPGIFTRTLNIAPAAGPLDLQVLQVNGARGQVASNTLSIGDLSVGVVGIDPQWKVSDDGAVRLHLPASDTPTNFKVLISRCSAQAMATAIRTTPPPEDLSHLCKGGPARYPEKITLSAGVAKPSGAFLIDDLPFPAKNRWNSRMRFGGFDFFKDGRSAAICTWDGDVWLVSGIDEQLQKVTWQRTAIGLFQPLGLKIVANAKGEEEIFVCCRDQIVRLHDLNNDGESDFYECFNGDHQVTEHFHEFAMGLQTDAEGNFYYAKAARHALDAVVPQHGTILKVSRDGSRTEIVCDGFRAPNGIGIGPQGEIITSDQEGFWMPANRINLVKPGGFYGNLWSNADKKREAADGYDPPLCWLPGPLDRSPAEDLWVSSDRWGPLKGRILHTSYGAGYISLVMHEIVEGVPQGGVVQLLPHKFGTGIMRGRFNASDGHLYVCGLVGWSSNSADPGGFYRIRYGGGPLRLPIDLRIHRDGVAITFPEPLDRASAQDVGNYAARRWQYRWTQNYGSKHYRLSDPSKEGQDDVAVIAASLSADGKTVLLKLEDLRPAMQMRIDLDVKAADGQRVKTTIHHTVNRLGSN